MGKIFSYFDKLEDRIRAFLSRHPISYAFIGGAGVVLFWRGVWHFADFLVLCLSKGSSLESIWWDGPVSWLLGAGMLLLTGTFISSFIGNELIITGIKGGKKLTEKTEAEIEEEAESLESIKRKLGRIEKSIEEKKRMPEHSVKRKKLGKASGARHCEKER